MIVWQGARKLTIGISAALRLYQHNSGLSLVFLVFRFPLSLLHSNAGTELLHDCREYYDPGYD